MFLRSRNKKGQAAMEFLMTYGWAILIAIIAIAALIAFGVLNVGRTTANICTLTAPWGCVEARADASDNQVNVIIQNSGDQNYRVIKIELTGTYGGSSYTCSYTQGRKHSVEEEFTYTLTGCPDLVANQKLKGTLKLTFKRCEDDACGSGTGLEQVSTGNFAQTIQE
ncbi:MAG: hypothetical protein QXL88_02250 [Candidatus Pacearchaeota archaeon]